MRPWRKRFNISVDTGNDNLVFLSKSGLHLATGYTRVVIGGRGAYIEFLQRHLVWNSIYIPESEEYRINDARAFYVEWRSKCNSNVKIYAQKKTVAYADYQIGFCYISPSDLVMATTCPIINPK